MDNENNTEVMPLGDAIERILVESGMSLSAFAKKIGYSRQYVYDLLRTKGPNSARKIQLDTLKQICDTTGYSLRRLLANIGYLPRPSSDNYTNAIIIVNKNSTQSIYTLGDQQWVLLKELVKTLSKK